jgi:prepilin-type N-terminal cleavage/methylation domain-containing protein
MKKKAFTLIELLVVIAIVGVLSAVVIASVSSARDRANVAAIYTQLNNIATQAEIVYNTDGTYNNLCEDEQVTDALENITNVEGTSCVVIDNDTPSVPDNAGEEANNKTIAKNEYGIAVKYNETYHSVSPGGVVTYDTENSNILGNESLKWAQANQVCEDVGKRLPTASELRALYMINNQTPTTFPASSFWSSTDYPGNPDEWAYRVLVSHGNVNLREKRFTGLVRCAGIN